MFRPNYITYQRARVILTNYHGSDMKLPVKGKEILLDHTVSEHPLYYYLGHNEKGYYWYELDVRTHTICNNTMSIGTKRSI